MAYSEEWHTFEDIERDLYAFSETQEPYEFEAAPPKTITEYRARMSTNRNKSIFDEDNGDPEDADVTYVISGRGRGGANTIIRPGEKFKSTITDDMEITKRLRAVSGLGYSNELIEQSIKSKMAQQSADVNAVVPDIKLKPTSKKCSPVISPRLSPLQNSPGNSDSSLKKSTTNNIKPKIRKPVGLPSKRKQESDFRLTNSSSNVVVQIESEKEFPPLK